MANVFARMLVQGVVFGVGVATKTFQAAYAKAQAGGVSAAGKASAAASNRMPAHQARDILGLAKDEASLERVAEAAARHYKLNDPDAGGSLYLQAKIWHAKEALTADIKAKAAKAAAAEGGAGGGSGAAPGGSKRAEQRLE